MILKSIADHLNLIIVLAEAAIADQTDEDREEALRDAVKLLRKARDTIDLATI